jgi:hypothetical protein
MCRSIKKLRNPDQFPSDQEIHAAALQYVRKVSGYRQPSRLNQEVFDRAVAEIAASTDILIRQLQSARSKA